jgi:hypothetical protein
MRLQLLITQPYIEPTIQSYTAWSVVWLENDDTPNKEENAIEVDEDNQMSVSDAVDKGTPLDHDTNPIFIK